MSVVLFLDKPLDEAETYKLAETTDLLYRKMRNLSYARRHADAVLPDSHTAMEAAAIRIIKSTPPGKHPANFVNDLNLAVLKPVTMSVQRAICLGAEGRVYSVFRGLKFDDRKFEPTALTLTMHFMLVSAKSNRRKLKRLAILRPTDEHLH